MGSKITQLTENTTPIGTDMIEMVDDPAGTPLNQKATFANATKALSAMVGDSGAGGTKGLVPAPASGDAATGKFLKADATWAVPAGTGLTQEQVEDIVGAMVVGGSDINATYDDVAGTVTIDATGGGGGAFIGGQFDQFRLMGFNKNPGSGTTTTAIGISSITPFADSATADDDADGPFVRWNTAATTNERAGTEWNNTNLVQTSWLPQVFIKMKTHTSISVCRIWIGVFSAEPIVDDPTSHGLGFRYSTAAPDTNWQAWSNDGSGGGTITDTGIAVATSTDYMFAIKVVSTSSLEFYISTDLGFTYTLVATHTTNLPTSTQGMNFWFKIITLENVAKSIKASFTHIRMR